MSKNIVVGRALQYFAQKLLICTAQKRILAWYNQMELLKKEGGA